MLAAQLFRRDILVSVAGRARTLRFTGPIFVRNANIEDMQTELAPALMRLRFRRVEYGMVPVGGRHCLDRLSAASGWERG